jgi:hypothetical protein
MIIMLNLLIAIIGKTYGDVKEHMLAYRFQQQAGGIAQV